MTRLRSIALVAVGALASCGGEEQARKPAPSCADGPLERDVRAEKIGNEQFVLYMAVDETHLYLAGEPAIVRVPKGGGERESLVAGYPSLMSVDAEALYFADKVTRSGVFRLDKRTGELREIAHDEDEPGDVVADGDIRTAIASGLEPRTRPSEFVYWVSERTSVIRRLRVSDPAAAAEIVIAGQPGVYHMAVDRENIYWTAGPPASLRSMPLGGGPVTTALTVAVPSRITLDAQELSFTARLEIGRVRKGETAPSKVTDDVAFDLSADGKRMFWTSHHRCEVLAFDPANGAISVVAKGQPLPSALVADATHVYWSNLGDDTIMRAAK